MASDLPPPRAKRPGAVAIAPHLLPKERKAIDPEVLGRQRAEIASFKLGTQVLQRGAKLGYGRFGDVFEATLNRPDDTSKRVAIKYLRQEEEEGTFLKEALILCRLAHPNIVPIVGVIAEADQQALVMDYIPQNLLQDLWKWGAMPDEPFLSTAIDIAEGLAYLHTLTPKKIIHRDLKPENILIQHDRRAKICDFGISFEDHVTAQMTLAIGTPDYMAPELLIQRTHYDEKVDVYSFAMVLLSMLKGGPIGFSYLELKGLQEGVFRPALPANTLPRVGELIQECWHQTPDARPKMGRVVEILRGIQTSILEEKEKKQALEKVKTADDSKGRNRFVQPTPNWVVSHRTACVNLNYIPVDYQGQPIDLNSDDAKRAYQYFDAGDGWNSYGSTVRTLTELNERLKLDPDVFRRLKIGWIVAANRVDAFKW